ncbi:hypothetical protein [Oryzomicrobium sp.]|uniref:hypothetical protein n=1 Tax=Oryzomicrobium sp. TaxID=1911578 RepID=UPI0025F81253|nr:hypothetical protein [Oryzomicrobium sp.]MCE1243673.1 hypothetical protein [Oryzomicrobium sp.]
MKAPGKILIAQPYMYFDANGERQLPAPEEVLERAKNGESTVLILDSNLCIKLSNYTRGAVDQRNDFLVRQFLLSAEYAHVDIAPFFGCIELSSSPRQKDLDQERLRSFAENVHAAIHQREAGIVEGGKPIVVRGISEFSDSIDALLPMLNANYACFLKISSLLSKSRKRDHALRNVMEYLEWVEAHRLHISLATQAALALFGGALEAQTLLREDKSRSKSSIAWGAAWDITFAWLTQNYFTHRLINGLKQYPIFATDDAAAAFVAGKCTHFLCLSNNGHPFLSFNQASTDFPHFSKQQAALQDICAMAFLKQKERILDEFGVPVDIRQVMQELESEIKYLEMELDRG